MNPLVNTTVLTAENPKIKIDIGKFDEDNTDAQQWVQDSIQIFELLKISDEKVQLAKLLSSLSSELAPRVQEALVAKAGGNDLTLAHFISALEECTHKSSSQIDSKIENIKFDPLSDMTLRQFYFKLLGLVKMKFRDTTQDFTVQEKIASSLFRNKVPASIKSNMHFAMSEKSGLALVDTAEQIQQTQKLLAETNAFDKFEWPRNGSSNRSRGGRGNRGGRGGQGGRGRYQQKSNSGRREERSCYYCGWVGHIEKDCRKKKREQGGNRQQQQSGSRGRGQGQRGNYRGNNRGNRGRAQNGSNDQQQQ